MDKHKKKEKERKKERENYFLYMLGYKIPLTMYKRCILLLEIRCKMQPLLPLLEGEKKFSLRC
jgi:hypothetical protein